MARVASAWGCGDRHGRRGQDEPASDESQTREDGRTGLSPVRSKKTISFHSLGRLVTEEILVRAEKKTCAMRVEGWVWER